MSAYVKSNGKLAGFALQATSIPISIDGLGSTTMSTGTWYYYTLVFTGTGSVGLKGYVNAVANGNTTSGGNLEADTVTAYIGQTPRNSGDFWNGSIDEVHISNTGRSADWITTEYNNQSAPGTFQTLGSEVVPGSANTTNFFFFFP